MYQLEDLLYLMRRLRDPVSGCPWDLKQNFASILPYTLEEAYEVADAIEQEDFKALAGELGDLLFQVVYHAQLATERGEFGFPQVVDAITHKLIVRHPHVFPEGQLHAVAQEPQRNETAIKEAWELHKSQERQERSKSAQPLSALADIPQALPALSRAEKIQRRAAAVGFDWPEALPVLDKMIEELDELRAAIASKDQQLMQEELGDCFFTLVNLGRHLQIDCESAVRRANQKFVERFQWMEAQLWQRDSSIQESTVQALEQLWMQAKQHLYN